VAKERERKDRTQSEQAAIEGRGGKNPRRKKKETRRTQKRKSSEKKGRIAVRPRPEKGGVIFGTRGGGGGSYCLHPARQEARTSFFMTQ